MSGLDSEGSMFAVEGAFSELEQRRELLNGLIHEPPAMMDLMRRPTESAPLEGYES